MPSKKRKHSSSRNTSFLPLSDLSNAEPTMKRVRRSSCASERLMPDILNASTEFGSPHKFWTSLCEKDESYYRNPDYMQSYTELEPHMRRTLISWILDVCEDLTLHRESFHLAIDFLDRLFSKGDIDVRPRNLQLIGVASLLLATKIEEVYPPKLAELVSLTAGACTEKDVRCMEEFILSKLEWHCSPVTAVQWLAFYLHLISKQELDPFIRSTESTQSDSLPSSSGNESMTRISLHPSQLDISAGNDSQYISQEPHMFRMTGDLNSSLDQSFVVKDPSQMRHLGQFSIPKLMRDDFIVLTKVIELCMFDMDYLQFTYSQIAAAILMLSYEPREQVEAIIGFPYSDLKEAINFVEPVIKATRASVSPGVVIPQFANVDPREYHNIQTGYGTDYDTLLGEIEQSRAERKRLADANRISRARKLF